VNADARIDGRGAEPGPRRSAACVDPPGEILRRFLDVRDRGALTLHNLSILGCPTDIEWTFRGGNTMPAKKTTKKPAAKKTTTKKKAAKKTAKK
jgi:hypothetical protein